MSHEMDNNGGDGDTAALFRVAYETLHGMAAGYLRGERIDHTLQPTALVHEAFLKLERPGDGRGWEGQTHFRAVAARAMRQILVDHARHRNSQKRGGAWQRVALSSGDLGEEEAIDFLALDEALERLADLSPRKAEVVELR
ncbi:MAG: ECF-type sigma factor, partial [Planctomycetota bacterium]